MVDLEKVQLYREVLHNIDEAVLFYNEEGKIVTWNTKTVSELYYDKADLADCRIQDLFHKSDIEFIKVHRNEDRRLTFEASVYRKNKTCFLGQVKRLIVEKAEVYGICIIQNIEGKKRLEEKLSQKRDELDSAYGAKDSFLANVTHELRTPLNGMKGMAELLLDGPLTKDQRDTLEVMMTCYNNMERIIGDVLDYSKLSAGKMELEEREFEFLPWINGIAEVHRKLLVKKNLGFELHLQKNIPSLLVGDSFRLSQVVNNLLSNAIKFTKDGKVVLEVNLLTEEAGKVLLIFSVTDTGVGIPEEKREQLFNSFVQVDPSITRKFGGTGLGLSICKEIITLMGGTIDCKSTLGQGARFYFTVPFKLGNVGDLRIENVEEEPLSQKESETVEVVGQQDLGALLKQLSICIDLKSYEKAEEITHSVKEMTKETDKMVSKVAFRLELALRKQDEEKIKTLYITLCKENKVW